MFTVSRRQYWQALTEYFYDNVYPGMYHISTWIKHEYRGKCEVYSDYIRFDNPQDQLMFMLRWGDRVEA
jgi:hypothetical protein